MSKMKAYAINCKNQLDKDLAEATLRLCSAIDELKRDYALPEQTLRNINYALDDAKGEARAMLNSLGRILNHVL